MKHKQIAGLLSDPRFVRRRAIWTVAAIVVILLVIGVIAYTRSGQRTEIAIGNGTFSARIARTEAARAKGLAGVTSLDANQAMLFVFKTDGKWQIWMKDMKIPIDIVWLDSAKKVVYIVPNAPFQAGTDTIYTPGLDARYVLELPAGTAANNAIHMGDIANFTISMNGIE
jgi:uncharacterized membrane protein (UPF0127 family)